MSRSSSVPALWLFSKKAKLLAISKKEQEWANQLPYKRAREFIHSRGYVRKALSGLWKVPTLSIPLYAPPSKPPKLGHGWGHISFSHCSDSLLIGWSPHKIGIDLERTDRSLNSRLLAKRYLSDQERQLIEEFNPNNHREELLKQWVIKEACIKWQRGLISKDLSHWIYCDKSKTCQHEIDKTTLNIYISTYIYWQIAIASKSSVKNDNMIICR